MINVALVYDFDGTLAPGNMQEYGFLQALGYDDPSEFWRQSDAISRERETAGLMATQYMFLYEAVLKGIKPTKEFFRSFGANVRFFPGVQEWFQKINAYGRERGIYIQHYIDSSGIGEMIEGTSIAKEFTNIYACRYAYDDDGLACWPAIVVDYSTKVQFLAKISKGIHEISDSKRVNAYMPEAERPIPMSNIIYFGDGETDIPSMRTVKNENGHSIAVFSNDAKRELAIQLQNEGRVNFACRADYSEGSAIDIVVKHILDGIALKQSCTQL